MSAPATKPAVQPPLIKSMADCTLPPQQRFLIVGPTGSGKSGLIRTLPGRKFVYVFDPNTLATIHGCPDCDYIEMLPEFSDLDATLKGFNKNPATGKTYAGDKPTKTVEPKLYMNWKDHINQLIDSEAYKNYQWLCFDSLTFMVKAMMDRNLWINNRYGDIEDLGDFRLVGSKLSDVFGKFSSLDINIFMTAHLQTFQDDKTKKIRTQMATPGNSRIMLPLSSTNCWEAYSEGGKYFVRTVASTNRDELRDIRTSLRGLESVEDVTIKDFKRATEFGIGALLKKARK